VRRLRETATGNALYRPVIDTRHEFAGLFSLYEWLMVAVTALIFAVVLFAVVRYRQRGDERAGGPNEAKVGESIYVVVLALIAAGLVTATFRTEARVDPVRANPRLRIDITAFQWGWRFDYPQLHKSVIGTSGRLPTLVVPARESIEFTAISRDVIHSFWVPSERFKRDAFPKRRTRFDLVFEHEGHTVGRCAEFCGLRHADMGFNVRILSPADFRAWSTAT
jgi:cytochrome c oxidase subunit II